MISAENIGIKNPEFLLPAPAIDLQKWAVIACDQFTSQPTYWEEVADFVGDAPSTFHMILPEVWLHSLDVETRITNINARMREYLSHNILIPYQGFMLVERTRSSKIQTGLLAALDLEMYDYNRSSQTIIRATEGTILNRLPPRMKVRREAPLELPHILVLYDDPTFSVLSPVLNVKDQLPILYDFNLMKNSGHLTGRLIDLPDLQETVIEAFCKLIEPNTFCKKYNVSESTAPLLFAMGDGNHSLATAKAIWEELKSSVGLDHPARYALVELINLHDPSLIFEGIHRIFTNVTEDLTEDLKNYFNSNVELETVYSYESLKTSVEHCESSQQKIGLVTSKGFQVIHLTDTKTNLAVASLQTFLDDYLENNPERQIDYVHGDKVLLELAEKPGCAGFYLPPIDKSTFFRSIILDGTLPKKTFSMGHAEDKRFYMECRRIR